MRRSRWSSTAVGGVSAAVPRTPVGVKVCGKPRVREAAPHGGLQGGSSRGLRPDAFPQQDGVQEPQGSG